MTSPLRPSIRAGASGRSRPPARTKSGTEMSGISTSGYGLVRATTGPPRICCGASLTSAVSPATPGLAAGSARPEHRLGAPEQRKGLAGTGIGHDGVPDLRRPSRVQVGGDGVDPPLACGAQVVALQLDRG